MTTLESESVGRTEARVRTSKGGGERMFANVVAHIVAEGRRMAEDVEAIL